ncbi:chemotaxis protein CheB [Fluviispira vulneris]|uniref:chemotaxis protein CheB n=1 Tax=Fluviispira vulneris TaxID=2763012 RepID=UPI0016477E4E|nr:chemotaxis protein CheB [Fluviispira vulneris]
MRIELDFDEVQYLLSLTYDLTGMHSNSPQIRDYILNNVSQLICRANVANLKEYLTLIHNCKAEYHKFLSAITVHTTGWFRESEHFSILIDEVKKLIQTHNRKIIRVLSIPCSTGEEVYSVALILNSICESMENIDFIIYGFDIDSYSIKKCKNAIYLKSELSNIPYQFHSEILLGENETKDYFALSKKIRSRCTFFEGDIRNCSFLPETENLNPSDNQNNIFDIILCRNLFIYFDQIASENIVTKFKSLMHGNSLIFLGHSEKIDENKLNLMHIGNSIYKLNIDKNTINIEDKNECIAIYSCAEQQKIKQFSDRIQKEFKNFILINNLQDLKNQQVLKKIKILIIDSEYKTQELINYLFQFTKDNKKIFVLESILYPNSKLRQSLSAFHESQIFKDFHDWRDFEAQSSKIILYLKNLFLSLEETIIDSSEKNLLTVKNQKIRKYLDTFSPQFIAIGASTGGTIALAELLKNFPQNFPPILIVQHLPHIFAPEFIEKLQQVTGLKYISPKKRPELQRGHFYLADGDNHIVVKKYGEKLQVEPDLSPAKKELRPCIDILFDSLARTNAKGIGILLTGMGDDGAQGLLKLMKNGCMTMTQDEASSVIYGMPKEAVMLGASCFSGNLYEIRHILNSLKVK